MATSSFMLLIVLFNVAVAVNGDELSPRGVRPSRAPQRSDFCRGPPGLPGRDGSICTCLTYSYQAGNFSPVTNGALTAAGSQYYFTPDVRKYGRDGRDAGLRGPPGKAGNPGRPGPRGPKGESVGVTGGAVYTRWGRKRCPKTSKTSELYSGIMAGSHYTHTGGGSNYLCLPLDPIYGRTVSGLQGSSYLYGTEYESQSWIFPKRVQDHDAPCAVCHTESRGSHVMIPARNVCPSGWTLEYKGYLMAEHHGYKGRTQYICVDGNPSTTLGSHVNKNGALLYFVEGVCGSLPCRPYVNGYELTCAVCTK